MQQHRAQPCPFGLASLNAHLPLGQENQSHIRRNVSKRTNSVSQAKRLRCFTLTGMQLAYARQRRPGCSSLQVS